MQHLAQGLARCRPRQEWSLPDQARQGTLRPRRRLPHRGRNASVHRQRSRGQEAAPVRGVPRERRQPDRAERPAVPQGPANPVQAVARGGGAGQWRSGLHQGRARCRPHRRVPLALLRPRRARSRHQSDHHLQRRARCLTGRRRRSSGSFGTARGSPAAPTRCCQCRRSGPTPRRSRTRTGKRTATVEHTKGDLKLELAFHGHVTRETGLRLAKPWEGRHNVLVERRRHDSLFALHLVEPAFKWEEGAAQWLVFDGKVKD